MKEIEKAAQHCDAVLVEWNLQKAPLIGSLAFRLRLSPAPLVGLVGSDANDSVAALVVGVDRTHPLPISVPLLTAQIFAHLRTLMSEGRPGAAVEDGGSGSEHGTSMIAARRLEVGDVSLDARQFRFSIKGVNIRLPPRQFDFMAYLMSKRGELVTRDEILETVWQIRFETGTNMVDVYVHFLRRILDAHKSNATIETVRGKGYRFATHA